jgi:hypothetical protein
VFLVLMVIGLVGLVVMAVPAFGGRGGHAGQLSHAGHGHAGHLGHGAHPPLLGQGHGGHAGHAGHAGSAGHAGPAPTASKEIVPADTGTSALRFIPSPRAVFSVFALYGAFGNALLDALHLPFLVSALIAVIPAFAVERFLVTPLWNLLFRFQGHPSVPLETLMFTEATAVTPFRNGRGIVSVMREGRLVQFSARLRPDEASLPVKVGERLRVEDVDSAKERFTVSVLRMPPGGDVIDMASDGNHQD